MLRKMKAIDRRTMLKGVAASSAAMLCSPHIAGAQAKAIKIGMPTPAGESTQGTETQFLIEPLRPIVISFDLQGHTRCFLLYGKIQRGPHHFFRNTTPPKIRMYRDVGNHP